MAGEKCLMIQNQGTIHVLVLPFPIVLVPLLLLSRLHGVKYVCPSTALFDKGTMEDELFIFHRDRCVKMDHKSWRFFDQLLTDERVVVAEPSQGILPPNSRRAKMRTRQAADRQGTGDGVFPPSRHGNIFPREQRSEESSKPFVRSFVLSFRSVPFLSFAMGAQNGKKQKRFD